MAVLVCGGAGYIGSHFVKLMKEMGEETVVLDALITGHRESISGDIPFYEVNLLNKEAVREVFKKHKITEVVHFAAYSLVGESMNKPLKYFNNNFAATLSLLEVMEEEGCQKIIFSSTAAVYGNPGIPLISEETIPNPLNPYGESKLAMEKMMKWQAGTGKLKFIALRYFNVAGASEDGSIGEDHNPETHIIPIAINAALKGKDFTIFGEDYKTPDGTCIRDYIHVEDLCDAHYLALKKLREDGESDVMNLGYGKGYSNREIVETVKKVTGINFNVKMGERRPGDPPVLIADSTKAKRELNWNPIRDNLSLIIESALKFHRNHPDGY